MLVSTSSHSVTRPITITTTTTMTHHLAGNSTHLPHLPHLPHLTHLTHLTHPDHHLSQVRHGQSEWNAAKRFTGWVDVDLTEKGRLQATNAGRLLKLHNFAFEEAHTSVLKRAVRTLWTALHSSDHHWIPVRRGQSPKTMPPPTLTLTPCCETTRTTKVNLK